MPSINSKEPLLGVWQNADASKDEKTISRFTFGKINKGHCKAVRVYGEATDVGECKVDAGKNSFTFSIAGAGDDPERFSFQRTGATLVLKSGDWGTQKFALVRDADVDAELAKEG
jgi:hypothetical protein